MSDKQVVVQGGNMYKVYVKNGKYYAYRSGSKIGEARSLEDALSLIKVHSGKEIRSIS